MSKFSCSPFAMNHPLIGYSDEKRYFWCWGIKTSLKVTGLQPRGGIPIFHLAIWTFFVECYSFSSANFKTLFKEVNLFPKINSGVCVHRLIHPYRPKYHRHHYLEIIWGTCMLSAVKDWLITGQEQSSGEISCGQLHCMLG